MNYYEDEKKWKEYVSNHGGNIYQCVYRISQEARILESSVHQVITPAVAIHSVLCEQLPKDLDKRLEIWKERKKSFKKHIQDQLSQIDDLDIREAVDTSCRMSIINKHLVYDYKDIIEPGKQSRVRILTRLILKDKDFKEETLMSETEKLITPTLDVEPISKESVQPETTEKRRGRKPKAAKQSDEPAKKTDEDDKVLAENKEQAEAEKKAKKEAENKKKAEEAKQKAEAEKQAVEEEAKKLEAEKKAAEKEKQAEAEKKAAEAEKKAAEEAKKQEEAKKSEKPKVVKLPVPEGQDKPINVKIGDKVILKTPLVVYRGPNKNTGMKAFQGYITIESDINDEFVKVSFVRPGIGQQTGYMIIPEQIKRSF